MGVFCTLLEAPKCHIMQQNCCCPIFLIWGFSLSSEGGILRTGYLVLVRVCLPVAVGYGGCWLVVGVVVVGVILLRCHLGDTKIDKIHKMHAPKVQVCVCFLREPQPRRQL